MRRLALIAASAPLLSCDGSAVENQRDFSKAACLAQAGRLFPQLEVDFGSVKASEENAVGNSADILMGDYRIVSTGAFVWSLPANAVVPHPLICTGDFNRHVINSITYNGIIKRPGDGEVWSF